MRLAEAPSHGLPIIDYDKRSRGALAYLGLAGEVIRHEKKIKSKGATSVQAQGTHAREEVNGHA